MRRRALACFCMLALAMTLLSGCDGIGARTGESGEEGTPIPTLPPQGLNFGQQDTAPPDEGVDANFNPFAVDFPDDGGDALGADDAEGDALGADALADSIGPGLPGEPETTPALQARQLVTPDPAETPIGPIDPWDKPTLEPLGVAYVNYNSAALSASFDRPAGWGEEAPADSNVQFVEPEAVARVPYLSKLTVAMFTAGSKQDQNDAKVKLLEKLDELAQNGGWQEFKATDTSAASMANAQGHYAYYTATFGDIKVRGRMMVVAHGSALYMVRISSPADFYSLYEDVYRRVRTSWKFN